jgi:hypothetical protein
MKSTKQTMFFNHQAFNKIGKLLNLTAVALILVVLNSCQQNKRTQKENAIEKDTLVTIKPDTLVTAKPDSTIKKKLEKAKYALALSPNALQMVNQTTGSTTEISFGTSFKQTVKSIASILNSSPKININSECGAGPLKFATWDNGLTLLFKQTKEDWFFVGWAANKTNHPQKGLTNMAGVGIGSTRKEMESATQIKVMKSTLGYEFSTKTEDLFGIFDGPSQNAKITILWSGVSCNFR